LDLAQARFSGYVPTNMGNIYTLHYLHLSRLGLRLVVMQTWRGNMRDLRELILIEVDMLIMERNELDNTSNSFLSTIEISTSIKIRSLKSLMFPLQVRMSTNINPSPERCKYYEVEMFPMSGVTSPLNLSCAKSK
jgi:hypothetical protein